MRIRMNYYTDLDPRSGNFPYGSKDKIKISIFPPNSKFSPQIPSFPHSKNYIYDYNYDKKEL